MAKKFIVNLQPVGRRAEIDASQSLLEAAQISGVELISLCGGVGACDSCKVRLMSGDLSSLTVEERAAFTPDELKQGFRLACQAYPLSDVTIDIPPESLTTPQRLQVEGQEVEIAPEPLITAVDIKVAPPSLDDLRADTTRINQALVEECGASEINYSLPVLKSLSQQVRCNEWFLRIALRQNEVVAVLPARSWLLGLAVDVGTTKIAGYLINLITGMTVAKAGAMNPQISYGEDVISRIAYAHSHGEEGRKTLQSRLVNTLNDLVGEMCTQIGVTKEQVVDAVIVGNTAMHHLLAGLPVSQLGAAPYVPAVSDPLDIPAEFLGLNLAPGAYVHLPSNIAGYVGGDHVAMVLSTGIWESPQTLIALDIGTNTEITLALGERFGRQGGRLLCCSCASGPAFEGAHIRDGMRAAPGAIENVQITEAGVRIHTIGDQPPVGICGSGILDTVATMLDAGVVDKRGVFQLNHPLMRMGEGRREFVLAPAKKTGHGRDVVVTRKDINEIQLAKGAIRAGIEILMLEAGISAKDLDGVIVAGAFGTYISIRSAIRVGMFPDLPMTRFSQVGNAAGAGARQMVISKERRRMARELAEREEYIELSAHPEFTSHYSKSLFFQDI